MQAMKMSASTDAPTVASNHTREKSVPPGDKDATNVVV